jgi:hypothetical protein
MLKNPEAQSKAQEEIDRVIGIDRLPSFEDEARLPYVAALVKEVFRWQQVAPFGMPSNLSLLNNTDCGYMVRDSSPFVCRRCLPWILHSERRSHYWQRLVRFYSHLPWVSPDSHVSGLFYTTKTSSPTRSHSSLSGSSAQTSTRASSLPLTMRLASAVACALVGGWPSLLRGSPLRALSQRSASRKRGTRAETSSSHLRHIAPGSLREQLAEGYGDC